MPSLVLIMRLHYNCLLVESIAEVQGFATRWLLTCNHERPNTGPGVITPKQKLAVAA
jgi:putative transposase